MEVGPACLPSFLPSGGFFFTFAAFKTILTEPVQACWGDLSPVTVSQDDTAAPPTEGVWDQSTTFVNRGFGPSLHGGGIWALVVGCYRSRRNSAGWIQASHAGTKERDQGFYAESYFSPWQLMSCPILSTEGRGIRHRDSLEKKTYYITSVHQLRQFLMVYRSNDALNRGCMSLNALKRFKW